MRVGATQLEIGFPAGSFQLSRLQDPEQQAELRRLAQAYFRAETDVRLVTLTEAAGDVPATLLGKKKLEETGRLKSLRQAAESHPMVVAALEIFSGEIAEIEEVDKKN